MKDKYILKNNKLKAILRFCVVLFFSISLYLPLYGIYHYVNDIQRNYIVTKYKLYDSWADKFSIDAPYILIKRQLLAEQQYTLLKNNILSPEVLDTKIILTNTKRQQDRFNFSLFTANIIQEGIFSPLEQYYQKIKDNQRYYYFRTTPYIAIAIRNNQKGLTNIKRVTINNTDYKDDLYYDKENNSILVTKLHNIDFNTQIHFKIEYSIKGAEKIFLKNMAKYSKSYIKSDAQYPTFKGAIDPTNIEITQKGFNVTYETDFLHNPFYKTVYAYNALTPKTYATVYLNSFDIPYFWLKNIIEKSPIFISLVLLTILCFEYITNLKLHSYHYVIIATALLLFYAIDLSLIEQLPFIVSYTISVLLIATMISLYIKALFRSVKLCLLCFGTLISLYSILLSLINIDNYSFIIGIALLVLLLTFVMQNTRKIHYK